MVNRATSGPVSATPSGSAAVALPPAGVTISAVLVDDEKLASDELAYLLKEFADVEVIATASNGLEAVKLIADLEPDLVFLDVQMPGLDGMGVIEKLRAQNVPLPYFVMATAYDQYAVEAFRLEALDYLLKPVEKDRLLNSHRVDRRLQAAKQLAGRQAETTREDRQQSGHQPILGGLSPGAERTACIDQHRQEQA